MKKSGFDLGDILADRSEDVLELPLTEKVFSVFKVFSIILVLIVFLQVLRIGVLARADYSERAQANASNSSMIKAERGIITDRTGKPLVSNEKAFFVFLSIKDLPKDPEEKEQVINKAGRILKLDVQKIFSDVAKKSDYFDSRVMLKESISYDELVELTSLELPGVVLEEGFKRVHSIPLSFSHILGYTGFPTQEDVSGRDNVEAGSEIGKMGLERYYDKYLRGNDGREVFFKDSLGRIQGTKVVELPAQGDKLETYIDKEFQDYFYNRLTEELDRLGRKVGVGIAINPDNGEVLALFGVPGFDSNDISQYLNDTNRTLFNRAVSGLYNPGSTIKPLHATAALTEGTVSPEKQVFSAGMISIPNPFTPSQPSIFKDWKAHGWVDVHSAIARSSNIYFYAIGGGWQDQVGLGIQRLKKWWHKFNLDGKTFIDLPGEESGFLPDPEWKKEKTGKNWLLGDTYNISIGQGDLVITPIELIDYIGAIANGGKVYEPRIAKRILNSDGEIVFQSKPSVISDLSVEIGPYISDVHEGMRDGVRQTYGTSYLLHNVPLEIYGKTGSAQIENNKKINAFFVGYTKGLAILVLVENARDGGANTTPVARDVFMWYYEHRIKNLAEMP